MLRAFRERGAGVYAFGSWHRAEAAVVPWLMFDRLVAAAHALEDANGAAELDRRRRHPAGPNRMQLVDVATALGSEPPACGEPAADAPAAGYGLQVWPAAADDLADLSEQYPPPARQLVADALADIAFGRQTGTPPTTLPGQPPLAGYRRITVPLGLDTASAALIVFSEPDTGRTRPTVELLAVLIAGPLVSALQELDTVIDLDDAKPPGDDEPPEGAGSGRTDT